MFKKVLIAEDLDDSNEGVKTALSKLDIPTVHQVQYCDDAHLKMKRALLDNVPYELLIVDLSFKKDHRKQKLSSGEALIEVARHEQPGLKIIVYSVEDRIQKVRKLIHVHQVDAYVCKDRRGLKELSEAIRTVYNGKRFFSPQIAPALREKYDLEIDAYSLQILHWLSEGFSQEEISGRLRIRNISPNSVSTIEKRINKLKEQFSVNNLPHLISIAKDLGLI